MQIVNVIEAASQGPTALRYGIWIAALLGAISVFYGVVFAASGGISNVLKNYWPKKDFIPYSERRRYCPIDLVPELAPESGQVNGCEREIDTLW